MRDVILCQSGSVIVIKSTNNETASWNCYFRNSEMFETVKLSVSISLRNLYNSLNSIKEKYLVEAAKHLPM